MTERINPTLYLSGIDTQKLLETYCRGLCTQRHDIPASKIAYNHTALIKEHEDNYKVQRFKDKNNRVITIHYNSINKDKKGPYRCHWDTCKFGINDSDWHPFGIPVKISVDESNEKSLIITLVHCVCSLECAYALLLSKRNKNDSSDVLYDMAEANLLYLANLWYGKTTLRPTNDPREMLKKYDGTQTIEQLRQDTNRYRTLPYVIILNGQTQNIAM